MNPKDHARAARRLIDDCGGLDACVTILKAAGRRGGRTLLSNYQTGREGATMSAEIMALLQADCGKPTYSDTISSAFAIPSVVGPLDEAVFDVSEEALAMQGRARDALADGELSARELDMLAKEERHLAETLETVRATIRSAELALGRKANLRAI